MAFNKTKNYQRYYALIYTEVDLKMIGKRALLFRSKDGEKARRRLKKENKGNEIKLIRIGNEVNMPKREAEKFAIELEQIGDV